MTIYCSKFIFDKKNGRPSNSSIRDHRFDPTPRQSYQRRIKWYQEIPSLVAQQQKTELVSSLIPHCTGLHLEGVQNLKEIVSQSIFNSCFWCTNICLPQFIVSRCVQILHTWNTAMYLLAHGTRLILIKGHWINYSSNWLNVVNISAIYFKLHARFAYWGDTKYWYDFWAHGATSIFSQGYDMRSAIHLNMIDVCANLSENPCKGWLLLCILSQYGKYFFAKFENPSNGWLLLCKHRIVLCDLWAHAVILTFSQG